MGGHNPAFLERQKARRADPRNCSRCGRPSDREGVRTCSRCLSDRKRQTANRRLKIQEAQKAGVLKIDGEESLRASNMLGRVLDFVQRLEVRIERLEITAKKSIRDAYKLGKGEGLAGCVEESKEALETILEEFRGMKAEQISINAVLESGLKYNEFKGFSVTKSRSSENYNR